MDVTTIFVGGISHGNPGPSAVGVRILDESNKVILEASESLGNATDTFAAYYAVMRGLQMAQEQFGKKTRDMLVDIKLDNETVKKQLNRESEIKEPGLVPYFIEIHNMQVVSFPNIAFVQITKEANKESLDLASHALGG